MAGVINNTQRQYNVKAKSKDGANVVARLVPGLNFVDDKHWDAVKDCDYVIALRKDGKIDYGAKLDKDAAESEVAVKSQSKSSVPPKDKTK